MMGGVELSEKLPDEIFQLVESFKKFVREQKAYRDQKFEVDPIYEISKDTDEFMLAFQRVAVDSDRNSKLVQQIKEETTKLLRHSELAYSLLRPHFSSNLSNNPNQLHHTNPSHGQSTFFNTLNSNNSLNISQANLLNDTSRNFMTQTQPHHGSPSYGGAGQHNHFANTTSSQYFAELADQFEARMKAYGEQIKELKLSLNSITRMNNVDELFKWLKKQHETLGEIAAKIYMTHERIMEKHRQ